jgi:C-terminal processing protease CtpA/Prc
VLDVGVIKLLKGSYQEKFATVGSQRGMIGFSPAVLDGRPSVTAVRPGLPGEKAGLKHGDLLLKIDGRPTEGMGNGALDFLAAGKADQPLIVTIQSREGGTPRDVTVHRVSVDYDPSRPTPAGSSPSAKGPTAVASPQQRSAPR